MSAISDYGLEAKFQTFSASLGLSAEGEIVGYASLFGMPDQGGDVVRRGAYSASLAVPGRRVKMLWQHDPGEPIGVWDELSEDATGLFVRGRILREVRRGAEALALMRAGAIDGLSIGYRTVTAERSATGRVLQEVELWEVSLVTFPMLPGARASAGGGAEEAAFVRALSEAVAEARAGFA